VSLAAGIASQREQHGIPHAVSCRALGVSQAWFYKWPDDGYVEFHNDRFDQLPEAEHVELVSQAIRRVGAVDPASLATALAPLAPHLPLDTLPVLVAEQAPESDWQRALAIAILAPPLPRFVLPKPYQPRVRARSSREMLVLEALAPAIARLPDPQRYELIARTLEVCARQFRPCHLRVDHAARSATGRLTTKRGVRTQRSSTCR
jgi:hypothetical protein